MMTVVSSEEFAINQDKYFDIAMEQDVYIQYNGNIFILRIAKDLIE
jgi:hypothetical protein